VFSSLGRARAANPHIANLRKASKLYDGTLLVLPEGAAPVVAPRVFKVLFAREDETPLGISKALGISCAVLLEARAFGRTVRGMQLACAAWTPKGNAWPNS
jgi:hypothetical protein